MMSQPSPSSKLLSDPLRLPLERLVSDYYGLPWRVGDFNDMDAYASHPAAVLSDGDLAVFAKLSQAPNGLDQLEVELAGLRLLADRAGVLVPDPIGIVTVEGGASFSGATAEGGVILVLEAVQAVERGPRQWREIGQSLARIHRVRGEYFGLETQGYFGPLYQDNRPLPDWPTFFAERRLWPRLMGAVDSGNLPSAAIRQVERLIARLPRLGLPDAVPCLLHGDAQQNNFISTAAGAVVIDPAVYYGSPEIDLAHLDYFEPVPEDVFLGYRGELPIAPGFAGRRALWRIPTHLGIIAVGGGPAYLSLLNQAVSQYL